MPHAHPHACSRASQQWRLALAMLLTVLYMFAEIVGGIVAHSLALLADAGHMLSDAAALALGLLAVWIARRPATPEHSYGYYRAEILAALANGAGLVAISIFIFVEAIARLSAPQEVEGVVMMAVAAGGLGINLAGLWILHPSKSESLNVHGAWLHLLSDALGSVAAMAAGALVWGLSWNWVDPVASILIAILVIYSAWGLLNESISILMQRTPHHIDLDQVRNAIMGTAGVCELHDLHIWTITSGMLSLSSHIVLERGYTAEASLHALRKTLRERFGIDHITIQVEAEHCAQHDAAH